MTWITTFGIIIAMVFLGGIIYHQILGKSIAILKQQKIELLENNSSFLQENEVLVEKIRINNLELKQLEIDQQKYKSENENIILKNEFLTQQREDLNEELQRLRAVVEDTVADKKQIAAQAFSVYCDGLDLEYQSAERHYDMLQTTLGEAYEQQQDQLMVNQALLQQKYSQELQNILDELEKMRATRLAAIEAQLQEQAIKEQKTFYSLQLDMADRRDVAYLQSIEFNLREARPLRMLIWSTFYRDKLNALAARVGAVGACGIYKITHIESGMCYIGQARDIKERWAEHCKKALGIDTPVTSKLYAFMREQGLDNFTFEVLEKCSAIELNEKEQFYINLYSAADLGLNSNKGIGK